MPRLNWWVVVSGIHLIINGVIIPMFFWVVSWMLSGSQSIRMKCLKASLAIEGNVLPQPAILEVYSVPALQTLLFSEVGNTETISKPGKTTDPENIQQLKQKLKKKRN